MSVTLLDANGQTVESKTVTTNAYGSAAGEFALPAGRALGAWHVRCDWGGAASIRVEEYKRPTFEATLPESKEALRLNRLATFHGEARYYFGLPVTNGSVAWRVTRETEYPWWWWWGWLGGGRPAGAETVATGKAALGADGTFTVTFTPKADERASHDADVPLPPLGGRHGRGGRNALRGAVVPARVRERKSEDRERREFFLRG